MNTQYSSLTDAELLRTVHQGVAPVGELTEELATRLDRATEALRALQFELEAVKLTLDLVSPPQG